MKKCPVSRGTGERVVVADQATDTMIQEHDLDLDQCEGHKGGNDILHRTRSDIALDIPAAFPAVGSGRVETNTFSAEFGRFFEYGIENRTREIAEAGVTQETAEAPSTPDHPRHLLGTVGPGTELPALRHAPHPLLSEHHQQCAYGLMTEGVDAVLIETDQDLWQPRQPSSGSNGPVRPCPRSTNLFPNRPQRRS